MLIHLTATIAPNRIPGTSPETNIRCELENALPYPFPQGIDPPIALPASAITDTAFTANWQSVPAATAYRLDVSAAQDFSTLVPGYDNLAVSGTTHAVTGLNPGTDYYYRVRAAKGTDVSPNSSVIASLTIPAAPTLDPATDITDTSFTANWQAVQGASDYRLDISTSSDFSTYLPGYQDLTVTTTSQGVTGLSAGTTYHYRTRAVNSGGTSANSNPISVQWTPAYIDSLATWYDASDASTIQITSGRVSSWTDKKAGVVLSQSMANKRPVLSNQAVVFAPNTGENLINTGISNALSNQTVFIVFEYAITSGWNLQYANNLAGYPIMNMFGRYMATAGSVYNVYDKINNYRRPAILFQYPYAYSAQISEAYDKGFRLLPGNTKLMAIFCNNGTNNFDLRAIIHATGISRVATKGTSANSGGSIFFGFSDFTGTPNTSNLPIVSVSIREVVALNENVTVGYGVLPNANCELVRQYLINKWAITPIDYNSLQ